MSNRIEHVTIVGGGTAGWLTALILNAHVNKNRRQRTVKITLIESPKVPTIGVGESTIQNLKTTLNDAGLDEAEFLRQSNGSFKLGVHYNAWSFINSGTPSRFFHALNHPDPCGGLSPAYHFRKFGPHWMGTSYGENIVPNAAMIAAGRGPRQIYAPNYSFDLNYAYHIDAGLFANFMRDFAVAREVEHICDDVADVLHDDQGAIAALQLEQRGRYPVEFVVDCTGFKALIWSRMGGEPFIPVNNRLLNDRAIPLQVPHREPKKIEPCTRATALGAGWVWRVPLYTRVGTGYVYSSSFRSDEEARAEFLTHLCATGDLPADAPDPETRVIKIRTGYARQPWIKNCVAIGLSSGFVEPLEATAIYSIDAAAHRLVMNFPDKQCSPALAKAFNDRSSTMMEEIVDFLHLNYLISNRPEPYWRAAREGTQPSDWLREKMQLWQLRFPDIDDTYKNVLFSHINFVNILYPRGYFTNINAPLDGSVRLEDWQAFGRDLKNEIARLTAELPSHYDLLTHIREAAPAPARLDLRAPSLAAAAPRF